MTNFRRITAAAALAAVVMMSQGAAAATQGSLGSTSTGTVGVSVTIPQKYRITSLTDITLGTYSGTGDLTGNDDVCVYTNDATKAYHVLITDSSSMTPSGFGVQNAGATASIPMTVAWNSATGTSGNAAVTYNSSLAGSNANSTSVTCATGGESANLQVTLAAADLQAAPADAYSTTLTIVIEP